MITYDLVLSVSSGKRTCHQLKSHFTYQVKVRSCYDIDKLLSDFTSHLRFGLADFIKKWGDYPWVLHINSSSRLRYPIRLDLRHKASAESGKTNGTYFSRRNSLWLSQGSHLRMGISPWHTNVLAYAGRHPEVWLASHTRLHPVWTDYHCLSASDKYWSISERIFFWVISRQPPTFFLKQTASG